MDELFSLVPTNSLVSGSFDILKMDNIDDPLIDINKLSTEKFEESYFVSTIRYLNKIRENYTNEKIKLYKAISETTDEAVVLESFSEYFVRVNAIADKFLAFEKLQMEKFFSSMDAFLKESETVKRNKQALENADKSFNLEYDDAYQFNIPESVPNLSEFDRFNETMFDDLFKGQLNDFSINAIKKYISETDFSKDYDAFRAKILNLDGEVYESNFADALYWAFRSNPEKIYVDYSLLKAISIRFNDFASVKSEINRTLSQIEKAINSTTKKISDLCKNNNNLTVAAFNNVLPHDINVDKIDGKVVDSEGMMMSGEMLTELDIFCKLKEEQFRKYTDIVALTFAAKLDAYKDQFQQDRSILFTAIDKLEYEKKYSVQNESLIPPIKSIIDKIKKGMKRQLNNPSKDHNPSNVKKDKKTFNISKYEIKELSEEQKKIRREYVQKVFKAIIPAFNKAVAGTEYGRCFGFNTDIDNSDAYYFVNFADENQLDIISYDVYNLPKVMSKDINPRSLGDDGIDWGKFDEETKKILTAVCKALKDANLGECELDCDNDSGVIYMTKIPSNILNCKENNNIISEGVKLSDVLSPGITSFKKISSIITTKANSKNEHLETIARKIISDMRKVLKEEKCPENLLNFKAHINSNHAMCVVDITGLCNAVKDAGVQPVRKILDAAFSVAIQDTDYMSKYNIKTYYISDDLSHYYIVIQKG